MYLCIYEVDEMHKIIEVGLELARVLKIRSKFMCFDVISLVDIDCAR